MGEKSNERKQAALEVLTSSGQFTPEQCKAIASAIQAVIDLLLEQMHLDVAEKLRRQLPPEDPE